MIYASYFSSKMEFPARIEPDWGKFVDRWYQLDAASFVLTETFWRLQNPLIQRPKRIFLASPGASNLTDAQFAAQAAQMTPSPARFVHTLPNVRSASLLKVMKWSGTVFCLQKDPCTFLTALSEAVHLSQAGEGHSWVVAVTPAGHEFQGHILSVGEADGPASLGIKSLLEARSQSTDRDFFSWLNASEHDVLNFVAEGLEMVKSPSR